VFDSSTGRRGRGHAAANRRPSTDRSCRGSALTVVVDLRRLLGQRLGRAAVLARRGCAEWPPHVARSRARAATESGDPLGRQLLSRHAGEIAREAPAITGSALRLEGSAVTQKLMRRAAATAIGAGRHPRRAGPWPAERACSTARPSARVTLRKRSTPCAVPHGCDHLRASRHLRTWTPPTIGSLNLSPLAVRANSLFARR